MTPHRHTYKRESMDQVAPALGSAFRNLCGQRLGSRRTASPTTYWNLVCPLQKALYGHPESGAIWEKHLSSILEELGWERVAARPGTWVHKETKALLAVYADELLAIAPPSHEKELWKALEERVNFDEELSELAKFLGAHHHLSPSLVQEWQHDHWKSSDERVPP